MHLPLTAAIATQLELVDEIESTNAELVGRAAAGSEPNFSVLATTNQTAGRGRLGRSWVAAPGTSLAVSVYLAPMLPDGNPLGVDQFAWLPLIAGAAMTQAVDSLVDDHEVTLKWPNDVLVDGLKVAGLLAELVPSGGVVLGAGLNLTMTGDELPVATATSLTLNGVEVAGDELADLALSRYLTSLRQLVDSYLAAGADARASGIHDLVCGLCSTLGQSVRVQLPGAEDLFATATGIDGEGRLLVRNATDSSVQAVAAGDVTHLRYE